MSEDYNPDAPEPNMATPGADPKYGFMKTTTYRKDGIDYPILQNHSIRGVVDRILTHNKNNTYTGILMIGKCLVAGSKVVLGDGRIVNIETLGKYNEQEIDVEIKTPQRFVSKNIPSVTKAVKFYKYDNMKTIEVFTDDGGSIRGTPNHPLMVNSLWVKLEDLSVGDILDTESGGLRIVKIIHHDDPVTVYDIEVPKTHGFISNGGIVSHNSGSGKTTTTLNILHFIHEKGHNYITKWFDGHDMLNMDKIIKTMAKEEYGRPHILVFDDASYTLEDVDKAKLAVLANSLTTIRHQLGAKVIVIMNIHYSKATRKFFRDSDFTFFTSITAQEIANIYDLFRNDMRSIKLFSRLYRQMTLNGKFTFNMSSFSGKSLSYETHRPFRLGMVAEVTWMHFYLYTTESCNMCDPQAQKEKRIKLDTTSYDSIADSMSKTYKRTHIKNVLGWFLMIREGVNKLPLHQKEIWSFVNRCAKEYDLDWNGVFDSFQKDAKRKTRLKRAKMRNNYEKTALDLMSEIKDEMENSKK